MAKYPDVTDGQHEAVLNRLGGIAGMNALLAGRSQVRGHDHRIDCAADPFVPFGLELFDHVRGRPLLIIPSSIQLMSKINN